MLRSPSRSPVDAQIAAYLQANPATVTWSNVTGKPTSFPPSAHSHPISDITGLQAALDAKQAAGSYVATANFTWPNLGGKPTSFPPSAHTHLWADITDRPTIPAATPLGSATPKALGTAAAAGTATSAAREDHVHPLPAGRLEYLGDINVTETLLLSLAVGMKRKTFALAGVAANDRLQLVPTGAPTAGCEAVNAYPAGVGSVSIGYYTPLLGIGATYAIPVAIYRIV